MIETSPGERWINLLAGQEMQFVNTESLFQF